ncbi:MAG: PIG-L family deacetylase [Pseudomonadales bacterium]|nr:PIG-L family deacetylase [Pseudomonadales bacterium]
MLSEEIPLFRNACIVAAHPDDEVLWFSSIVSRVAKVFICFLGNPKLPGLGRGRRTALVQPPLDSFVSLALDEADVYDLAYWPYPDPTPNGVALAKAMDEDIRRRYQDNFASLTAEFANCLEGFDTVFTHNPWGEYGHEEHIQVYRAVRHVQAKLGFQLWCSSYAGSRSHALMTRCLEGRLLESISLETDVDFARQVAERYKENGVWTWFDDYVWPDREAFLGLMPPAGKKFGTRPVPINYLDMGQPLLPLADRSLRQLARKFRSHLPLSAADNIPLV